MKSGVVMAVSFAVGFAAMHYFGVLAWALVFSIAACVAEEPA